MGDPSGSPAENFDLAVIGMAGRFPGASTIEEFWDNLCRGVESISSFTDEEVATAGVGQSLLRNPHYVKAGGVLENAELFDASFFGYYPLEATIMDPQQRVFLECAWEALERAGHDPDRFPGLIGVWGGCGLNTYLLTHLLPNRTIRESVERYHLTIGNDKDFLATRVSYKLNLRGPSVNVQSACSTSLVAVHLASQALLNYQCDMALAGGVAIRPPQKTGYLYQEGGILSPDGHCRAFDREAGGTVAGNGAGILVLRRLADALADGDHIHAVIKGSAINNDGSLKAGYTAPSVRGQADVISTAHAAAGVSAESISYVEAHGTGTALGDPIEVEALTQAFRGSTWRRQYCALGSVKTNVGHLDAAAGVAGAIKTVLTLEHRVIPPSLHYRTANPRTDFENSPFYVNASLSEWESEGRRRRAGVSSFGLGGTNAHVVFEEAPEVEPGSPGREWHVLTLSAKTESALEQAAINLAAHLKTVAGRKATPSLPARHVPRIPGEGSPEIAVPRGGGADPDLADVAYTLQVGRKQFGQRQIVLCRSFEEAIAGLQDPARREAAVCERERDGRPVVFLFSGQGSQYVRMAERVYREEPYFREQLELCARLLEPHLGRNLLGVLFPAAGAEEQATRELTQTSITQPALFALEYALARQWMDWGVRPAAMTGHSIGEYVAACLAGVFSLEEALGIVAARGRMMQSLPRGAMLSVPLPEDELTPLLGDELSLAAINAPGLSVASGREDAIGRLESELRQRGIASRRLHTSHAFHSPMMEPILGPFAGMLAESILNPPDIPFISNVTGTWITASQATDPRYWATHLRRTVRFGDGIGELLREPSRILLEIGPGNTLAVLARQHPECQRERAVIASLPHPREALPDTACLQRALGRLWLAGAGIEWPALYRSQRRRRVLLPAYPFERERYWADLPDESQVAGPPAKSVRKLEDLRDWFYSPAWRRADLPESGRLKRNGLPEQCLLISCGSAWGERVVERLRAAGRDVTAACVGDPREFAKSGWQALDAQSPEAYGNLITGLLAQERMPERILVLTDPGADQSGVGFYAVLHLAQALARKVPGGGVELDVVTWNALEVTGEEALEPHSALVLGLCRVIPQEFPGVRCRLIDLEASDDTADRLSRELAAGSRDTVVAYRGRHRWVEEYTRIRWEGDPNGNSRLRENGVYLITGGLGRIGLVLARDLVERVNAKLTLVDLDGLPDRSTWDTWLGARGPEDPVSRRIQAVRELESRGAKVLIIASDVADESQMRDAIRRTVEEAGALHGVFHAAGVTESGAVRSLLEAGRRDCEVLFHAKVTGTQVLGRVLEGRELDFCVLFSSLSAVLGGLGLGAYAAANCFLDTYCHSQNRTGRTSWISINWDAWRFGAAMESSRSEIAELSLSPEEGMAVLRHALSAGGLSRLIVSTADLQARIERWATPPPTARKTADAGPSAPRHKRPRLRTAYEAPRNDLERQIVAQWQAILGIEDIGVHDDFFELGGHSLLGTQLISRIRDTFHVELPLRRLFDNPTVSGLAALVTEASAGGAASPVRIAREEHLPLSFGQQRLWFLDQLEPGSPLYNNSTAVRLRGPLCVEVLERCVNEIARRHEILRTTYSSENGQPVQVIHSELKLKLPVADLRGLGEAQQREEVARRIVAEARKPFNLSQLPLLRCELLRLGDGDHVALLTMHHIVSDGWTLGVLVRELAALYEAFSAGRPSPLPEFEIQYVDFAAWQRSQLRGDALEEQLEFWRKQLDGAPPFLDLPADRPRPAIQSDRGSTVWHAFPRAGSRALQKLAGDLDATLFMILVAAFHTLLMRYTGEEDICIGTPIANRNRAETEPLIGFFVNTLVLRINLPGDPTFRDLVGRVRETSLNAFGHQDLPFEMLVDRLQPERDLSRTPLFQVMFVHQNAPMRPVDLPGLLMEPMEVDNGTAKFDLTLFAEETPDGMRFAWNFATDLFERSTIERIAQVYMTLLESAAASPDSRLSRLAVLTAADRELPAGWAGTGRRGAEAVPVAEQVEAQAAKNPSAVALVFRSREMSYGELNQCSTRLARSLRRQGAGPETLVGLYLERSPELIIGMLGALKAGAGFLPLDPSYPPERLAFMIEDSGVEIVLTQGRLETALPPGSYRRVCLDSDRLAIDREGAEKPPGTAGPESLAYVIYTSGSTGRPKGVVISQGAFALHCTEVRSHYELASEDKVLQFASPNFDAALEQIFPPLASGATVVLRESDVWDARELHGQVLARGLTIVNLPPAYWQMWVQEMGTSGAQVPESLRLVIVGGDVLPVEGLRAWREIASPRVRLLNAYGPTETTITATTHEAAAGGPPGGSRTPIGRPIGSRRAHILDRWGNPVPAGVRGELHLGGTGVARGYLGSPEITAERFIPDPFSGQPGARLYCTGDLARYREDGAIEFLGRADGQVKIRGFRIELGEIEHVLAEHPAIREAVVVAREDSRADKRVIAYVTAQPQSQANPGELESYLKDKLPDFMLPSAIVPLEKFPLTPGGKVDRRALPAPESGRLTSAASYEAPRDPVEETLAAIWREVLGLDRVGIHDDFFRLGGHSLLATQAVAQVRDAFPIEITLRDLFQAPTIAGLAAAITEKILRQADEQELAGLIPEIEGRGGE